MTEKTPDPSTKMLRSGFGKQVKSVSLSNPSWGFGTSVRDSATKQYISPEHAKVSGGNNSQGPVYKIYSSVGPQPESNVGSSPAVGFGTSSRLPKNQKNWVPGPGAYKVAPALGEQKESKRSTSPKVVFGTSNRDAQAKVFLDDELMRTYYGKESPGPMAYVVPPTIGPQVDSRKESLPGWRMGSANRFKYSDASGAAEMPGAGQYRATSAVGKQALSSKKTLPSVRFGTSTRDAAKKTFISKEHEKQSFGELSPGPGTANQKSSMGKQLLSVRASSPGWGFGSSQRITDTNSSAPGPGSYYA